jgi:hypothetical protein
LRFKFRCWSSREMVKALDAQCKWTRDGYLARQLRAYTVLARTCPRYPKHRPSPPLLPHLVGVDCITNLHLTLLLIGQLSNMSAEAPPKYIYKIVPSAPEDPFPNEHPLSELDRNDGFVHLSTATQVSLLHEPGMTKLKQYRYLRQQICFSPVHPHSGLLN